MGACSAPLLRRQECLERDEARYPRGAALLRCPRAVLAVLAWNSTRHSPPVRYGRKLAFSSVRPVQVLPLPPSRAAAAHDPTAAGGARPRLP